MKTIKIQLEIPEDLKPYVNANNSETKLRQNTMLLYPYILDKTILHGKTSEILGIAKLDLIGLYAQMGFSYLDLTMDYSWQLSKVNSNKR